MATPAPSHYIEARVKARPDQEDPLSVWLFSHGCSGVYYENHNSSVWRACFNSGTLAKTVQLMARLPAEWGEALSVTRLACRDWNREWRSRFTPIPVDDTTVIVPPWRRTGKADELVIEPGQAFGTGSHPSTRLALQLINQLPPTVNRTGARFLDFGAGSGILSIALCRRGLGEGLAIDNDPVCEAEFYRNCRHNGCASLVFSVSAIPPSERFAAVVVNMLLFRIKPHINELISAVAEDGFLIISGLLARQFASLPGLDRLFTTLIRSDLEEWRGVLLQKKTPKR